MANHRPSVIIIAGPNGAGKSTAAPSLLRGALGVDEFVNADVIAQGISAFNSGNAAMAAGRIMLARLKELARGRESFAFETTLASRSFAPWTGRLIKEGFEFHLVYLWLSSSDLAISRVQSRVRLGGHEVPDEVVRRRYHKGLKNFFHLYRPLATIWRVYDNSQPNGPKIIASGLAGHRERTYNRSTWNVILRNSGYETQTT